MFSGFWLICIPVGFLFLGVLARKVAGPLEFRWRDWYLGIDFALVALSTAILNGLDLYRQMENLPQLPAHNQAQMDLIAEGKRNQPCLFLALVVFLLVGMIHRIYEERQTSSAREVFVKQFMLVFVANALGCAALVCFTYWVKGLK